MPTRQAGMAVDSPSAGARRLERPHRVIHYAVEQVATLVERHLVGLGLAVPQAVRGARPKGVAPGLRLPLHVPLRPASRLVRLTQAGDLPGGTPIETDVDARNVRAARPRATTDHLASCWQRGLPRHLEGALHVLPGRDLTGRRRWHRWVG